MAMRKSRVLGNSFGKLTGFKSSHFLCEGDAQMLVVEVGVSKYMGVLMRLEL